MQYFKRLLFILITFSISSAYAFKHEPMEPSRLGTSEHLIVIDKGSLFIDGKKIRLNKRFGCEELIKIFGEPDDEKSYTNPNPKYKGLTHVYSLWNFLGIKLGCKVYSQKSNKTPVVRSLDIVIQNNNDIDREGYATRVRPASAHFIIDGVYIDNKTGFKQYQRKRNHDHYLYGGRHSQTRFYNFCHPVRNRVNFTLESDKRHPLYQKLYKVWVFNDDKFDPKCHDYPYEMYIKDNCDRECAKKKGFFFSNMGQTLYDSAKEKGDTVAEHALKKLVDLSNGSDGKISEEEVIKNKHQKQIDENKLRMPPVVQDMYMKTLVLIQDKD